MQYGAPFQKSEEGRTTLIHIDAKIGDPRGRISADRASRERGNTFALDNVQ